MSPFFYSNLFHLVHNFQYLYCRSHSRIIPKIVTRVRRVMQPELNLPPPPSTGPDRPSHPPARPTEMFQMHVPVDHTATSLVLYRPPELVASSVAPFPNGDGICRSAAPMCDSSGSATNLVVAGPSLSIMEPLESIVPSLGSTTATALEDDANSFSTGAMLSRSYDGDSYSTPTRENALPFCGTTYEPACNDELQPKVGMEFDSWENGESFYTRYAHEVGFSVRTGTQHLGKGGVALWKRFVCAKQGWRKTKELNNEAVKKRKRNVKISRCGCEAMIGLKRRNDGKYVVARLVLQHTHQLVSPNKRQFLRSNREVNSELRSKLFTCHKALLGTSATYRMLTVERGPGQIGCLKRDLQNYYRDFKEIIKDSDAQTIIGAMKSKQSINPSFFFDYKLDEENKLTHIFWADGTSRKNYALFGQVVSFDSTYRTNQYDMVFAPFTGVNHHDSSVTFGAAFLANETFESYEWLFSTFLAAMGGVAPKLIITDEDASMKEAVPAVFPSTRHRFCMWHILNKLPEKVGRVLMQDEDFLKRFGICVWASETPNEFEEKWNSIISDYGLGNNGWLASKFGIRQRWIPAYFRDVPLGGILRTTSRSESENAFFGHFLNRRLSLLEFWIRYETAMDEQRQKELENDNISLHTQPVLSTNWGMESHGRDVYTHSIFKLFQTEVLAARDKCDLQKMEQVGELKKTCLSGSGRPREVIYNTRTKIAQCSCKMFESVGIPCSHIIIVLKWEKCLEIPSHYVLDRWTKTATQKVVYDGNGNVLQGSCTSLPSSMKLLYSDTCSKFNMGMIAAKQCEEKMKYFKKAIFEVVDHVLNMGTTKEHNKVEEFESFVGSTFPTDISIHPPDIAHTKGNGHRFRKASEIAATGKNKKRAQSSKKDKQD